MPPKIAPINPDATFARSIIPALLDDFDFLRRQAVEFVDEAVELSFGAVQHAFFYYPGVAAGGGCHLLLQFGHLLY